MIEVELPDGRIVEFPDEIDPNVMQGAIKKILGVQPTPQAVPQPAQPVSQSASQPGPQQTANQFSSFLEGVGTKGNEAIRAYQDWMRAGGINQYLGMKPFSEQSPEEIVMGFAGPGAIRPVGAALNVARGAAGRMSAMPPKPGLAADFVRSGVDPSIPALAQNRGVSTAANVIHDIPWAGDPIAKGMQSAMGQSARAAERLAGQRGAAVTREQAGQAIQKGIGRFTQRDVAGSFAQKADDLFEAIPVKPEQMVSIKNTASALKGPSERFPTAPKLGRALTHPKLTQWKDILEEAGDELTWGELRELRSQVGKLIPDFKQDIPTGDLKQLYGAISDDLKAAADASGATKAFNRANIYYRSGMSRLEGPLGDLRKAATPEAAYAKVESAMMSKGAASKLRAVKRSLSKEEWGDVVALRVREMGKPTAGATDVLGEAWSPATFVTEYAKMNPSARNVMFTGPGLGDWKMAMDSLVRVAGAQKNVSRLANPSGSGRFVNLAVLGGLGTWAPIETAMTTVGARAAAEAMMSPKFIRAATNFAKSAGKSATASERFLAKVAVITEAQEELRPVYEALQEEFASNRASPSGPLGP